MRRFPRTPGHDHRRAANPRTRVRWYSLDGKHFKPAGDSFKMREGKWIGAKFGFVAACKNRKDSRGWLDIDWIRITL